MEYEDKQRARAMKALTKAGVPEDRIVTLLKESRNVLNDNGQVISVRDASEGCSFLLGYAQCFKDSTDYIQGLQEYISELEVLRDLKKNDSKSEDE